MGLVNYCYVTSAFLNILSSTKRFQMTFWIVLQGSVLKLQRKGSGGKRFWLAWKGNRWGWSKVQKVYSEKELTSHSPFLIGILCKRKRNTTKVIYQYYHSGPTIYQVFTLVFTFKKKKKKVFTLWNYLPSAHILLY